MRFLQCLLFLLLAGACTSKGQDFDQKLVYRHVRILANDSLQGRGTGTEGERAAAAYIQTAFNSLKLQPKGDNGSWLQSFTFNKGVHGEGGPGVAFNIIGYLDNKAKTTIIIGAHYDHLGMDGQGSSLDANPENKIHNGADDNASGVAGVIELARYFSTNNVKENNNFLFACFSGEEKGLLGSKFMTENPPIDLATVDFMINLDMIGRLDEQTKKLMIHGTGTSPTWEPTLSKMEKYGLSITTDSSGTGPSDHTSFYLKNIPVLHFFTGAHSDYHKPEDDIEKVNVSGEVLVLKLIADLIEATDAMPKLTFLQTKTKMQASRASFKVTMGIMPSYAGGVTGLRVDGVSDGKPAANAGIKTGDVIVKIGDYDIKDIYAYMEVLGKFEKGQTVPVVVKRGGEELKLSLTF